MPNRRSTSALIRHVQLGRRRPEVSVDDLAMMLGLEAAFGLHKDFRRRLQRALDDACRQGKRQHNSYPPGA